MKVSVLNLVPVRQGSDYRGAIAQMERLAQHIEQQGYERYWIAEHHNMENIASSATQLLIERALSVTERLRVGSGGVMLPNHSPYVVAEQYGTLDVLYPGRVDLGLGRAPGTDQTTAQALRRGNAGREFRFAEEIQELQAYFQGSAPVTAVPAQGRNVPLYVLGSSTDSAFLAARLGLPYAFASHFAPDMLEDAVRIYRSEFRPSAALDKPYVIVGANAVLASTDQEAERLLTSQVRQFLGIVSGERIPLSPPVDTLQDVWNEHFERRTQAHAVHFGPMHIDPDYVIGRERRMVEHMMQVTLCGSVETALSQLDTLYDRVGGFDELIATSYIYDEQAQLDSYTLLAQAVSAFNAQ